MFCGTRSPKFYPTAPRVGSQYLTPTDAQKPILKELKKVFGTWDFKWPLGHKIRVAFQALPSDHPELDGLTAKQRTELLASGIQQLMTCANRWVMGDDARRTADIEFDWHHDPARWWPEPASAAVSNSGDVREVDYDVLVSLAPLPVAEPDTPEAPGEMQFLPRSQLGSYARRADGGVPTVYVGRAYYLTTGLPDYFDSSQFRHCVVHEFGHVLGLAHANQNPLLDPPPAWQPAEQIARIFADAIDEPVTASMKDFATAEVIQPWPAAVIGGQVMFSDWPKVPPARDGRYTFDSIMVDPLVQLYLTGSAPLAKSDLASYVKTAFDKAAPSPTDLVLLASMYPLRVRGS